MGNLCGIYDSEDSEVQIKKSKAYTDLLFAYQDMSKTNQILTHSNREFHRKLMAEKRVNEQLSDLLNKVCLTISNSSIANNESN